MMIDERRMIVRLQRWLTTRRQRPRQAHRGPATARLPALIAEAADGDQRALRELAGIVVPFVNYYCRVHLGHNRGRSAGRPGDLQEDPQNATELPAQSRALLGLRLRRDRPCRGGRPAVHLARALLPGSPVRRTARPAARRPRLRPIAGPATRDPPIRAAGSPRPASTAPPQRRRHRQDRRNVARHRTAHPTPRTQSATPRTTSRIPRPALPDVIADRRPRRTSVSAPIPPDGARVPRMPPPGLGLGPAAATRSSSASSTRCQRRPAGRPCASS